MSHPPDYTWNAKRGEKWAARLEELEASFVPVDAPLIRALRVDTPVRIADIGSGGGGTAQAVVRAVPRGSVVHGYDISPKLVAVAKERAPKEDLASGRLCFEVANAQTSTPSEPYDRLVSRFGVMFFDEPTDAFANLASWLVPRGRLAFAVWAALADNPWLLEVREAVGEVVEVPLPEPDAPGPFRYAKVEALLALLEGAGFGEVSSEELRCSLPIGGGVSAADAASFAVDAFGGFSELLEPAGPEGRARATNAVEKRLASHVVDGIVRVPAAVHIVTAVKA